MTSTSHNPAKISGIVHSFTRIQRSRLAQKAIQELELIGKLACNTETAEATSSGLFGFSVRVTELDTKVLEQIRDVICTGLEYLDSEKSMVNGHSNLC